MVSDFKQPRPRGSAPALHLVGDATMADQCLPDGNAARGWGQLLHEFFRPGTRVLNHARDGRSSRSFIWEGHWARTLVDLRPGDWLVVQFGHNDRLVDHPLIGTDPAGSYADFLSRFVRDADRSGVNTVFATPVHQRRFDATGEPVDTLGAYARAMRDLAEELEVPLIDLHEQTGLLPRSPDPRTPRDLFLDSAANGTRRQAGRRTDTPRLSETGARIVANLFAQSLRDYPLPLADWLLPRRRTACARHPRAARSGVRKDAAQHIA
ncbi:MAG: GDSL-type esterase/lipase family protein [Verrucomicrobiota bacterium]